MKKNIVILGAGGFAAEAYSWAAHCGRNIVAFYSELPSEPLFGIPVVQDLNPFRYNEFIIGIGNPRDKKKLWQHALLAGLSPSLPIIHSSAILGNHVQVNCGSIICPNAVLTARVVIEEAVIVNIGATIGHDCRVRQMATISPGANISGHCTIESMAYIGTNASVRERITIGVGSTVGMGAVVVKDVPDDETHIGTPARKMLSSV